jgi:predicted permease
MMNEGVSPVGIQDVEPSPTGDTRVERRGNRWLFVKGRLAEGVTIEQAQANVEALMAHLEETYPESNEDRGVMLMPVSSVRFHPMIDSALTPVAGLLLGVVGLVLLIACANIANMLLARAWARRREIAVRLALGASRGRLVRQLLTESFLLAGTGGLLGFLLSIWASRLALAIDALASLTISFDFGVDFRVFTFALMASLSTGLAFGLVPALRASRPQFTAALKGGDAISERGRRRLGLRDVLVVSQIAISLLLLVGAALLLRSLQAAKAVDLGFDVDHTAMQEMQLEMVGYSDEQAYDFQRQLLERLRALPEVEAAALVQRLPLSATVSITDVFIPGVHESDDDGYMADETYVGPRYFETMGIPLLEGRDFSDQDTLESPRVAIVNETMARTYWPGEDVIGKRFHTEGLDGPEVEIVGVARDHKVRTVGEDPRPYVHFAHSQQRSTYSMIVARTRGDVGQLVAAMRREINAMEPELASGESSMRESVQLTMLPVSMGAKLLTGFGALAMLLAAMGLYGIIAYSVTRRFREIGIRIALGADYLEVIKLVVRRGMVLALVGTALGAAAAAALSSLLRSVLYGISSVDPIAFLGAAAVLLGVAFLANYIPARRAAAIDPMIALRNE